MCVPVLQKEKILNKLNILKMKKSKNTNRLKYELVFAVEKILADKVVEKENTIHTDAYKSGLITPFELLANSKMNYKGINF